jgi:hypothetical protein
VSDTAFISRRLDIHPAEVACAVADWHRGLPRVRMSRNSVTLDHRLWLASRSEPKSSDPFQLYAVQGILWVKSRPIRMSLEFSMWSLRVAEVALRPTGMAWPVGTKCYADRVTAILDDVITSLVAPAVQQRVLDQDIPVSSGVLTPLLSAA